MPSTRLLEFGIPSCAHALDAKEAKISNDLDRIFRIIVILNRWKDRIKATEVRNRLIPESCSSTAPDILNWSAYGIRVKWLIGNSRSLARETISIFYDCRDRELIRRLWFRRFDKLGLMLKRELVVPVSKG